MKRIALVGGGTGGHIYPLIAVHEQLHEVECRYFGPQGPWAKRMEDAGIPVSSIASAKLRRYFSPWNFVDGPKFVWSFFQALVKVAAFAPDAAFSKGGTGSLPVLCACLVWGVPIITHESDSVPSAGGKIAGRWARMIELGWENTAQSFPGKRTRTVGVPLRKEIRAGISKGQADAKRELGLDPSRPAILVIGGSQGSDRINAMIMKELPELLGKYQILHQIGPVTYAEYMKRYGAMKRQIPEPLHADYWPYEYMDKEMPTAYAAADIVISRAGSAIFEIAAYGKPSILIPLPEAANGHQRMNAEIYATTGAAIMLEEKDIGKTALADAVKKVMERQSEMAQAAKAFVKPDAAERIAEDIQKATGK